MQTRPLRIGPAAALKVTVHACHNILRANGGRGPRGLPFVSPHVARNLCPFKWGEPTTGGKANHQKIHGKIVECARLLPFLPLAPLAGSVRLPKLVAGVNHTWHCFRPFRGVKASSSEWKLGRELCSISRLVGEHPRDPRDLEFNLSLEQVLSILRGRQGMSQLDRGWITRVNTPVFVVVRGTGRTLG